MATINNCNIPDDLHYMINQHMWVRRQSDGSVLLGITDVAQKLAGKIVAVTTKKVGRAITKGQSTGTIESSKWVGPIPSPLTGEIVAVNGAPQEDPTMLNRDPYGNWIVRLRPSLWDQESGELVTGPDGVEAYRRLLEREGIDCGSS
ncbi:MAG: glycine cleavage system protein GcvH [Candidatus Dormibacteria bacterium]